MTRKIDRQKEILRVIGDTDVATQVELRQILSTSGFKVDQATLSRDIRELGLVKVTNGSGLYRYSTLEEASPVQRVRSAGFTREAIRSIEVSRNMIVIKTDPGVASPVGLAIDRFGFTEIIGTVAGDDTLLLILKETANGKKTAKKIREMGK